MPSFRGRRCSRGSWALSLFVGELHTVTEIGIAVLKRTVGRDLSGAPALDVVEQDLTVLGVDALSH